LRLPNILSINIALPELITFDSGKTISTAIRKHPATSRIFLDTLGFEGDGSADQEVHGGPDKAVCAYSYEHFNFWENHLSHLLSPGAFGENLTVSGMTEPDVHIGDTFQIGDAEIQCTQPRQPCHKLKELHNCENIVEQIRTTGFCGFYFRVIKCGWVQPHDLILPLKADPSNFTVLEAHQLMNDEKKNSDRIQVLLSIDALSDSWREEIKNHAS
jgi:MOSC domain-containing protein YiiM